MRISRNLRLAALAYNAQSPAGELAVASITPLSTSAIYPCPIAGVAAPCQRHGAHGLCWAVLTLVVAALANAALARAMPLHQAWS